MSSDSRKTPPAISIPPRVPECKANLPKTVVIRLSQLPFAREQRMVDGQAILPQGLDYTKDFGAWWALPVQVPSPLRERAYGGAKEFTPDAQPGQPGLGSAPQPQPYAQPSGPPAAQGYATMQQPQGRPGGLGGVSDYEAARRRELEEYERKQREKFYGVSGQPQQAPAAQLYQPSITPAGAPVAGHAPQSSATPSVPEAELKRAREALTRVKSYEDRFLDSLHDEMRADFFRLIEEIKTIAQRNEGEQYAIMKRYRGILKEKLYWLEWQTYQDYELLQRFRVKYP